MRWHRYAPLWVLLGLSGCGEAPLVEPIEASLAEIQERVFTPGCAHGGCHDASGLAGGLDLSAVLRSYESLVSRQPTNAVAKISGWLLVEPGAPERSFLMRKLDGPGLGEGAPMPSATETVAPFYRDLIVSWITRGAEP